jgi:hypothetical protein
MNISNYDQRPLENKHVDLALLDILQEVLEESIPSYAIENSENLFDEEYNEIIRKLEFSKGLRSHFLLMSPDGILRMISNSFPRSLLVKVHNALITYSMDLADN